MKTVLVKICIVFLLGSCTTVQSFRSSEINHSESACKNPVFISTVAKTAIEMGNNLSFYSLTKYAQANYGSDVSVQNIYWEIKAGQKISVVFDVVKCGTKTE